MESKTQETIKKHGIHLAITYNTTSSVWRAEATATVNHRCIGVSYESSNLSVAEAVAVERWEKEYNKYQEGQEPLIFNGNYLADFILKSIANAASQFLTMHAGPITHVRLPGWLYTFIWERPELRKELQRYQNLRRAAIDRFTEADYEAGGQLSHITHVIFAV